MQKLLADGKLSASSIGSSTKASSDYSTLLCAGLIEHSPTVTGGGNVRIKDREALTNYFATKFPDSIDDSFTAVANVKAFRNTKAAKRKSQNVILVRGTKSISINGAGIDLMKYTAAFGTFSAAVKTLEAGKICLVENLDSYLIAEQIISNEFIFIHTYGGIGKSVIGKIKADEILVFPDYDFKGLHNYLLVKSMHPATWLFVPTNYDLILQTRSRTIKTKQGREQQPSKLVLDCEEEIVVKIRTDIFKHKKFVEQQAAFE